MFYIHLSSNHHKFVSLKLKVCSFGIMYTTRLATVQICCSEQFGSNSNSDKRLVKLIKAIHYLLKTLSKSKRKQGLKHKRDIFREKRKTLDTKALIV